MMLKTKLNNLSSYARMANFGAILVAIGWFLAVFSSFYSGVIALLLATLVLYVLHIIFGKPEEILFDTNEIMGVVSAFTYISSGVLFGFGVYYTILYWGFNNIAFGAALSFTAGSGLILTRFFLNFYRPIT